MKKIFYALFAAAFAMSCSEATVDEGAIQPDAGQGTPIEFYAEGSADSRTTYFEGDGLGVHWEQGDFVPIIVRGFYDKSGVTTETRTRGKYAAESAGASTKFVYDTSSELSWEFELPNTGKKITEQPVDFVSFYCNPYSASTTIYNGIEVKSDYEQTQAKANDYTHVGDYMVMASNIVHREAGDTTPVTFKYTNVMSIVELTLKGDASKAVSSIELNSNADALCFQTAYLAVEDWTTSKDVVEQPYALYPANGNGTNSKGVLSQTVTLSLDEPAALSAEGTKFYLVVMPGQHDAGDITLTVQCTDNTVSTVKMGAINFEMNKVYRPVITLTEFVEPVVYDAAELELSGNDASKLFGSVNFENGAHIVANRTKVNGHGADMFMNNIPEKFYHSAETPWQTLSVMSGLQLDLNVKVKTSGMVYVMVGCHNAASYEVLLEKGWEAETPIKSANATADQIAGFATGVWDDSFPIFYATSITDVKINDPGYFTIFSRYYEANESFNLKDLMNAPEFRGIRIVAKKFTWPVAQAEIQKTVALSDGELKTFEAGSTLGVNHANSAIADTNNKENVKSVPAGYVGMKFFALKRGTSAAPNCRTVTAKITKSGMLYQLVPKNAQSLIKPQADGATQARDAYNGWRVVEWFYLNATTANPFYISAQWVEAGTEVKTYDYTDVVTAAVAELNYFNTGILMGDLTVKEITE